MMFSDKIKGALFGVAFGDALGFGGEFMTRPELKYYYPQGLRHFDQIIRDAHRCVFRRGDWTNDTEITMRLFETIIKEGHFDLLKLTSTMKEWFDSSPDDLSPVVREIMSDPEWPESPAKISHRVWRKFNVREASNEALLRSIVTGMTSSRKDLLNHTAELIQVTHDDPRCIATACMIALTAHSLLHHNTIPAFEDLLDICETIDTRTVPYLRIAYEGNLSDLDLDDEETLMYTRKAMASALWALWHTDNPSDAIFRIIDEGGDADTNAAVTGALVGLRYGYDALPDEKEKLLRREYLEDLAERLEKHITGYAAK